MVFFHMVRMRAHNFLCAHTYTQWSHVSMLPWATSWWGGRRRARHCWEKECKQKGEWEGGREGSSGRECDLFLKLALGGGTESCFRGVLKGLYKLLPPVSSKRETVQIRKWSWSWNLNSLSHHTHLFSLQTAVEIFFIYEQYRIR